ncbi:MAG: hypothetical protein WA061_02900 [Microgenomates group bacterium]
MDIEYVIEKKEEKYYLKTTKGFLMCVCDDEIIANTIKMALEEMLETCIY